MMIQMNQSNSQSNSNFNKDMAHLGFQQQLQQQQQQQQQQQNQVYGEGGEQLEEDGDEIYDDYDFEDEEELLGDDHEGDFYEEDNSDNRF